MILETVCVGPMQVNCYILAPAEGSQAIIIDPGDQFRKIKQVLDRHRLTPAFIINTHGHYDHIGCNDKFNVPVYIHSQELVLLKDPQLNLSGLFAQPLNIESKIRTLEDNEIIELENMRLKVMHMPGHTPGGIVLFIESPVDKIVFTGDSLFFRGIGRSDLAGGNQDLLIKSIREKLMTLADDTVIYPGHGPSSTIGEERRYNPFLVNEP